MSHANIICRQKKFYLSIYLSRNLMPCSLWEPPLRRWSWQKSLVLPVLKLLFTSHTLAPTSLLHVFLSLINPFYQWSLCLLLFHLFLIHPLHKIIILHSYNMLLHLNSTTETLSVHLYINLVLQPFLNLRQGYILRNES